MHSIKALINLGVVMKKASLVGLVAALGVLSGCTVTTGNGANAQEMSGSDFLSKLSRTVDGDRNAFARKPVEPAATTSTPQASVVSSGNAPASSSQTNKAVCDEVRYDSTLDVDVAYARIMRTFKLRTAQVHAKELEDMWGYESDWLKANFRHETNAGVYYHIGDQVRLNLNGAPFVMNQTEPFFGAAVFELAKDKPLNILKAKYCVSYSSGTNDALLSSYRQKAKSFITTLMN